jgi:hypothetical protein
VTTSKLAFALLFVMLAAGCETADPTATLQGIQQNTINETFSGSVPAGTTDVKSFTVGQGGGPVGITVTAAGPAVNIQLAIALGTVSGNACSGSLGSITLTAGQSAVTMQQQPGTYCVSVGDALNTGATITYTLTISHP